MALDKKVYNIDEVAEVLGISVPTAHALAKRKDFPSMRVGERRIVVPIEAFDRWLNEECWKQKSQEPDD